MVLLDAFENWLKDGAYHALYMRLKYAGGSPVEFIGNVPHVSIHTKDGYGTFEFSSRPGQVCEHCRQKPATKTIKFQTRTMMHDTVLKTIAFGSPKSISKAYCAACADGRDRYVSASQNDGMDDYDDPIS